MAGRLFVWSVAFWMLLSCGNQPQPAENTTTGTGTDVAPTDTTLSIFRGVLPCADCPGIQTELRLSHATKNGRDDFQLLETYVDRNDTPVVTHGEWTFERGHAENEDAVVIVLVEDSLGSHKREIRYEVITADGSAIQLLGQDLRPIRSELNYSLLHISGPPVR